MTNLKEKFNITEGEFMSDERVVERNVEMMNKEMMELLMTESIGGNAGDVEIAGKMYSGAAANGFADPETGEIVVFKNIQDVPEETVRKNVGFTLRLAFDWKMMKFLKIVNFWPEKSREKRFSVAGRAAIESSIERWNKEQESN